MTIRVVETWADRWRSLKSWGRPLSEVETKVVSRKGSHSTGVAYPTRRTCRVRAGHDLPDALATVLHEYAHLAAPADAHHGIAWRSRFVEAVAEVTGIVLSTDGTIAHVDQAASEAVKTWWHASGNAFAVSLLKR